MSAEQPHTPPPLPPDEPTRQLTIAERDDSDVPQVALAGETPTRSSFPASRRQVPTRSST